MLIKISSCYTRKEFNDSIIDLFAIVVVNDTFELYNVIYYLELYAAIINKYNYIRGINHQFNFIVDKLHRVYNYEDFTTAVQSKIKNKIKRVNKYQVGMTNDNIDKLVKDVDIENIKQITCLDDIQYVVINEDLKHDFYL